MVLLSTVKVFRLPMKKQENSDLIFDTDYSSLQDSDKPIMVMNNAEAKAKKQ
jgi:hypothetical protein